MKRRFLPALKVCVNAFDGIKSHWFALNLIVSIAISPTVVAPLIAVKMT